MTQKIIIFSIVIFNITIIKAQNDTIYYDTGQIEAVGEFVKNKREGEWIWFYRNGQQMSAEKYENGKFKSGKFWNEKGESISINEILVQPKYPKNGLNGFAKFISKNLIYPADAVEKNIEGKVIVDFSINSKGKLVDLKIHKSVYESVDNEALRVLKKSRKWIPGTLHGERVKVSMRFPLDFQL